MDEIDKVIGLTGGLVLEVDDDGDVFVIKCSIPFCRLPAITKTKNGIVCKQHSIIYAGDY